MPPTETRSTDHDRLDEPTIEGAFSDDGVDLTVICWMLRLTPTQSLQSAQAFIDAAFWTWRR